MCVGGGGREREADSAGTTIGSILLRVVLACGEGSGLQHGDVDFATVVLKECLAVAET